MTCEFPAKVDFSLTTRWQSSPHLLNRSNDVSTDKCRSGSSACVTKRSDPTYWKSIGRTLDTQLVFSEEKGLSVVMNGGETCRGGNYWVVIDFVCTPDSVNMVSVLRVLCDWPSFVCIIYFFTLFQNRAVWMWTYSKGKPIYTDDDPEDCGTINVPSQLEVAEGRTLIDLAFSSVWIVHQFTWMSRYG